LVLQIKEKQPYFGIKKRANQFIMQSFGKIEEQQNFVKNLKKIKKKNLLIEEQDY